MSSHIDPMSAVIFWVTVIFLTGTVGRYIAWRFQQPGVLGELLMGILLGNGLYVLGEPTITVLREGSALFHQVYSAIQASTTLVVAPTQLSYLLSSAKGPDLMSVAYALDLLARFGVIFLLFMVGLESSVASLRQTGRVSIQVACIGIIAPLVLGLGALWILNTEASWSANLFVAATLTATSVGITASVLKELQKMKTREANIILGAAMLDDVLGLVLLAVVSSLVIHQTLNITMMFKIMVAMTCFFVGTLWLGPKLLKQSIRFFSFLPPWQTKLVIAFLFLMGFSWLATLVQLSSIVGAFMAGLILHDGFFTNHDTKQEALSLQSLIAPFEAILAPLVFVLMGIQVKLGTLMNRQVIELAFVLIAVAIVGKLLSGLGASKQDRRWLVGVGMLPRGEVGIVFASIGRTLGVMSDALFSAIICMVLVTTLIAPSWIKYFYKKKSA